MNRVAGLGIAALALAAAVAVLTLRAGSPPNDAVSVAGGADPANSEVLVEVLNGCGVPGAASRVASKLREGRFAVERTGNAPEYGYREDLVIARNGNRAAMNRVADYLGCDSRIVQRRETADVDVTVIVGRSR